MKTVEKKLRDNIHRILKQVKQNEYPAIYDFIQTETGYKRIEDIMINMFIKDNIKLSATLMYIEKML